MLRDQRAVREGDAVLSIKIGDNEKRTNIILKNSNPADGTVNYIDRK